MNCFNPMRKFSYQTSPQIIRKAQDRADGQPQEDMGGVYRRGFDDYFCRRVDRAAADTVFAAVRAVHGGGDRGHGFYRGRHVLGAQARFADQGLRQSHSRSRRDSGPDRLAFAHRAAVFPLRTLFLFCGVGDGCG